MSAPRPGGAETPEQARRRRLAAMGGALEQRSSDDAGWERPRTAREQARETDERWQRERPPHHGG